jgi:hypothetical protein
LADKTNVHVSSRHTPSGQLMLMAGLLARGSLRHPAFPALPASGSSDFARRLQLRGQPRPRPEAGLTVFPFHPSPFDSGDHHRPTVIFRRPRRNKLSGVGQPREPESCRKQSCKSRNVITLLTRIRHLLLSSAFAPRRRLADRRRFGFARCAISIKLPPPGSGTIIRLMRRGDR